ncbi:MAG TPA: phage/plasmid primase, P4 family [Cyclobacteriaceae bacterium]|jgi:putative DNA primase/helicase|nr:phage/plasmid primase, P4 family [Cyclobacteriaceae bacterium]
MLSKDSLSLISTTAKKETQEEQIEESGDLTEAEREMIKHPGDSKGTALCCSFMLKGRAVYSRSSGWRLWNGKMWEDDQVHVRIVISEVMEMRRKLARRLGLDKLEKAIKITHRAIADCENMLKDMLWLGNDESGNEIRFNEYINDKGEEIGKYLVPCKNVVVDIRTKKTYKHDKRFMFTYILPTEYIPGKKSKDFDAFLTSSVGGGKDGIDYLLMYAGYALTDCTDAKKFCNLYGPTNSGKGTFKDLFMKVTGSSTIEIDYNVLSAKRSNNTSNFDLFSLSTTRAAFCSEPEEGSALNSEQMKKFTGDGDRITTSKKFKDQFSFIVRSKIFILSNHMVRGRSNDNAFWERLVIINFPHDRSKTFDPKVKQNLLNKSDNLEAALTAFIDGAHMWYNSDRRLVPPQQFSDEKEKHRESYDQIKLMLDECFIDDPNGFVTNEQLMKIHKAWSFSSNTKPFGPYNLGDSVEQKGYSRHILKAGGSTKRGHKGLRLRNQNEGGMSLMQEIALDAKLGIINNQG